MSVEHKCPYGGWHRDTGENCGGHGWLCDRCREDRADYRAGVIADAIAAQRDQDSSVEAISLYKPEAER